MDVQDQWVIAISHTSGEYIWLAWGLYKDCATHVQFITVIVVTDHWVIVGFEGDRTRLGVSVYIPCVGCEVEGLDSHGQFIGVRTDADEHFGDCVARQRGLHDSGQGGVSERHSVVGGL